MASRIGGGTTQCSWICVAAPVPKRKTEDEHSFVTNGNDDLDYTLKYIYWVSAMLCKSNFVMSA